MPEHLLIGAPGGLRRGHAPRLRRASRRRTGLACVPVGWQCLLDLFDCQQAHFDEIAWVRQALLQAAHDAEATVVAENFHRFSPYGISGVVVIAQSHIAVHTWPERRYAAVDLFTCSSEIKTEAAIASLIQAFQSADPEWTTIVRGTGFLTVSAARPFLPSLDLDARC